MKTIISTLTPFILVFVLVFTVQAQEGGVTLHFRVTVMSGAVCPNATYWAVVGVPDSEGFGVQLTDPDGDGVFTGSTSAGTGNALFIRLVQGTGTQQTFFGPLPGEPSATIKDFGLVTITGDMVFEGSVSGCPVGLPDTGVSESLPVAPLAGALLAGGIYLRRRVWQPAYH